MEIPKDNQQMTEKYLKDKGGICGQTCIAVLMEKNVSEILEDWKKYFEWKGFTPQKDLVSYLKKKGYEVKRVKEMSDVDAFHIARVQWIGEGEKKEKPFYGWGHWTESSAHTHYLIIKGTRFFCNQDGLYGLSHLEPYLKHYKGIITSFLEIKKSISKVRKR